MAGTVEKLPDGFSSTISLTGAGVTFWEVGVKPPGADGGDPIDTTTMRNTAWRTKQPRQLMTLTDSSITVAYDPTVLDTLIAQINVNQELVVTFPDGGTWTFWGFLQKFEPEELKEGEFPLASATIVPTNENNSGVEVAPAAVAGSGT